jgi:hypothetical protein
MAEWYTPLDPDCPNNPMEAFYADPITIAYGANDVDQLVEKSHRSKCKRCQEYGLENIDVN